MLPAEGAILSKLLERGWLLAGLFGAFVYLAVAGPAPLDVTNTAWIYRQADIAGSYTGWTLYRDAPWSAQIAANPDYGIDFGGSILFSDAVPLMALPLKAISAVLPDTFQYFGLWTFASFVLQGAFGWFLMGKATPDRLAQLLGAMLLALAPIYIYRLVSCTHMSLTAHWLVLGALYLCLPPHSRRSALWWGMLLGAAAFVHAYIFCMVATLWLADLIRRVGSGGARGGAIEFAAVAAAVAAAVVVTGVWAGPSGEQQGGFGWYKMNVLSFMDPEPWTSHRYGSRPAWSFVLPDVPNWGGDYEGFAYLGLGGLFLMAAAAWALWRRWRELPWRNALPYWPLAGALIGLVVFALSRNVTIGNFNLYAWWPSPLHDLGEVFRATGRFIWPLYYVAFVAAVFLLGRHVQGRVLSVALAAIVVVQAADTSPGWMQESQYLRHSGSGYQTPLASPFWRAAAERYDYVRQAPHLNGEGRYLDIATMARERGLATDASYLSRTRTTAQTASEARIEHGIATGEWPTDTLFVIVEEGLAERIRAANDPARNGLFVVDGVVVLAPNWAGCEDCGAEAIR
jgi:hypothetical protein